MDTETNLGIKVEKEANMDDSDDSFEEYTLIGPECKQEDEMHITHFENDDSSQPTTTDKGNKRKFAQSARFINCHTRKLVVNHFITNGWSSKSYKDLRKKVKEIYYQQYTPVLIQQAREAQQYVYQECDSLCFGNINAWLETFKEMNVPANSFYEPAIIMNAIVNNEMLPRPEELGGVNLKQIYSFLCNGLMGLPQPAMDLTSAKFLAKEFETLIDEANSELADSQTLYMKQKIRQKFSKKVKATPSSMDPLWLTEGTILEDKLLNKSVAMTKTKPKTKATQKRKHPDDNGKEDKQQMSTVDDESTTTKEENIAKKPKRKPKNVDDNGQEKMSTLPSEIQQQQASSVQNQSTIVKEEKVVPKHRHDDEFGQQEFLNLPTEVPRVPTVHNDVIVPKEEQVSQPYSKLFSILTNPKLEPIL
ncbi:uncharacterized protein LOC106091835 [Stomoxys calcitrans]|uniref:uncharacterized protein LOC106091835 n=1 Tax=Stomoxys calcitrans TaxID=35570 RepID=UPI0027E2581C|nr:uncharacterized protein LOC106091835 [Stomoxys calcitrans]